ncbi:OHCU decarboxylase [Salipaludibacillus keqinensis]|uniref:2-oxo-4-hydroxy-4-carboxy-5-ureidoimidazoline decarboxylase n=1 Tax=Salipaludibacillus keqinensis TaxID=2045207 RepID=A0A323TJ55_9BACI|nr:2-oxo-4-hydroxy-4-carboxy-5-ureidoimidazoline decarboxylase [Salipaludibacillus keqinensis]PYZ94749.1 OHCU decarboxylase [Salipaludibacillus keqinensis]
MYSLQDVNDLTKPEFTATIGAVFEHSPWVAQHSWKHHPFVSVEEMHDKMVHEMMIAETTLQLSLLRAHPDLGTKLSISDASKQEQEGAGLSQLTAQEYNKFSELNKNYTEKFGFPFIMAVKGQSKENILAQMQKRYSHSYDSEMETALQEVSKIAKFRLDDLVMDHAPSNLA